MPSRFPHLPGALHRLLEAGPWQGTPTELYATLEAHQGHVVARTELLRVAVATANVGESTAKKALQEAVTRLGAVAVELPGEGRGRPAVGYRLPPEESGNQNNQKSENPVQDDVIFGQNPLTKNPGVTKNPPAPDLESEAEAEWEAEL